MITPEEDEIKGGTRFLEPFSRFGGLEKQEGEGKEEARQLPRLLEHHIECFPLPPPKNGRIFSEQEKKICVEVRRVFAHVQPLLSKIVISLSLPLSLSLSLSLSLTYTQPAMLASSR